MESQVTYRFQPVSQCNLCGSAARTILGRRLNRRQGWWPHRKTGITTTVARCRRCSLIYTDPMPVPENVAQHYDVPPESYWTADYFAIDPAYLGQQLDRFKRLSGKSPHGLAALDVGAGIGKGMIALQAAGFDAWGVEPSDSFRQRGLDQLGIAPARIHLAMIEDAEFPPAQFDFIHMGAVLEHLYAPDAVLRRVLGWLKTDGLIYVEVPSSAYLMSRLARLFYRVTGTDYVINTCPMHAPYHLYEFGVESFRLHGAGCGYTVAFHEYYPCTSYLPGPIDSVLWQVMRLTDTGMQLAVWLRKV